ncbi:hypothetical protein FHL15_007479 [Xylaria flabelliformis]|uniref:non-specific serine/threonine protein kinase n=1 Tax=Xylaria flabelliformis TaxID=2512241 RepID=A0A553HUT8_9PEZI|nr:hypothetical protein FHL15_007479 [Xylaria flabelliformis]
MSNERRVGVKVFQAEKSTESQLEIAALRLFEGIDRQELRSNRIFTVDDHFWINGPNGRHLCLVVQVLGLAMNYKLRGVGLDTPDLLSDLCFQAAQSLMYLHTKKICHGDFRADHMRLQLDHDAMSNVGIYDLFGKPKVWHLDDSEGEDSRPDYLVEPVNLIGLEKSFRTGKIAIDSFASSYRAATGRDNSQTRIEKAKTFVAEHNLCDQVEYVEQYDGTTKFPYRLQPGEVELLTNLLRDMLRSNPDERISIDEVLQHKWFEASRKHLGVIYGSYTTEPMSDDAALMRSYRAR